MERHITFTSATGETTSCSVYDIADTLTDWYPDAPAEVTDAISELARKVVADRYPETSEEDALLGLSWEWAELLDMAGVSAWMGRRYATVQGWRRDDPSFPVPDVMLGQSAGWWPSTIDAWQATRPGRGAGGGRPRKARPSTSPA